MIMESRIGLIKKQSKVYNIDMSFGGCFPRSQDGRTSLVEAIILNEQLEADVKDHLGEKYWVNMQRMAKPFYEDPLAMQPIEVNRSLAYLMNALELIAIEEECHVDSH